jgi:8-oxo-dGTP pyrophosphatase MutT (NUDIX family)
MDIGTRTTPGAVTEPRDAATVVLLRDGDGGLETLLLKRNKALMFAGGVWVFPGGAVEPSDLDAAGGDIAAATRLASLREAQEEAGLGADARSMVQISHWTTPSAEPKRFRTWFYAAAVAANGEVTIDGSEIHDSEWISIRAAVTRHRGGSLGLFPPTLLTLLQLSRFDSVRQALEGLRTITPPRVTPVIGFAAGKVQLMFSGDAGYGNGDPATPGARHRVTFDGAAWNYHHEPAGQAFARLDVLQEQD